MTSTDLLSAVLADPFDDGPRLVYADWLQENGEPERAEFIREAISRRNDGTENGWIIQPHVHHKNAAAFKIVLKDSQYLYSRGFPDEIRCTMVQWVGENCRYCNGGYTHNDMHYSPDTCSRCHGTGRTPGIAKAVCEAWPVTKVVLVDRQPAIMYKEYGWYVTDRDSIPSTIPMELWSLLPVKWAKTQAEALAALSHAALTYGRRLAGLPELENK